ncbi:MAG: oligosaccharide flippase family protein [Candidatus Gastranaerophilales bacterium]|nr:oligosaccharide flippase family protein [Candidatus Gastranaerophilales bacterium]
MDKKKELVKNTLILAAGKLSVQLISLILIPVYTFFLSPKEYGLVDLIITYAALLIPVITLQLELAAFRFLVDCRDDEEKKSNIISSIIKIDFFILISFLFISITIANFVNIPYFWIILANISIGIFCNLFLQIARGLGKNKEFAISSSLISLVNLILTILLLVVFKTGVIGVITALTIANLVCAAYLFIKLNIYKYFKNIKLDKKETVELLKYSVPLVPNGVSWWVVNLSGRTIISIVISTAANGVYAIASKIPAIFMSIFGIFSMSWTESISSHIHSEDKDKFVSETFNASVGFFSSLGLILIATTPIFLPFLIDSSYMDAINYVPIMIVGSVFNIVVGIYGSIYVALKLTKKVATTSIYAAIINLILSMLLISDFGLYGPAIATAIAFLAMATFRYYDIKKYIQINYDKKLFINICILSIVIIAAYYANNIIIHISSASIALIFFALLNIKWIKYLYNKVRLILIKKR